MTERAWEVKKFDGKYYKRYGTEPTKEGAERTAKLIRAHGHSARISKYNIAKRHGGGHFYIIWINK